MKHPVRNNSGSRIYLILWTGIALIHFAVLRFYFELDWLVSAVDSLAYNVIFAALSMGLWFVLRFAGLNNDGMSLVSTHVGAALLTVGSWVFVPGRLLGFIFEENAVYLSFLNDSFAIRGIVGFFYYTITMLVFYVITYYQESRIKSENELELQNLLKDSELQMLKSQINPHFIFNSLNSVSSLTVSNPEMAQAMVIKLSEFLRFSLGKKNDELHTLKSEIESVQLYLDIEKIRFGDKLLFETNVEESALDTSVPNLILQPLIENAVKYGMYDNLEGVNINLNGMKEQNKLKLTITNNFDANAIPTKGEGIGLENVQKRLQLIFGEEGKLKTETKDGMFTATLEFPAI